MTTAVKKTASRRASAQKISDERYRMQCFYRITMSVLWITALAILTFH